MGQPHLEMVSPPHHPTAASSGSAKGHRTIAIHISAEDGRAPWAASILPSAQGVVVLSQKCLGHNLLKRLVQVPAHGGCAATHFLTSRDSCPGPNYQPCDMCAPRRLLSGCFRGASAARTTKRALIAPLCKSLIVLSYLERATANRTPDPNLGKKRPPALPTPSL